MGHSELVEKPKYQNLLRSMLITKRFALFSAVMLVFIFFGLIALLIQLDQGLVVTGMRDRIFYGTYITNFVFWIGVSHAGMFITGILRVANVEWRTPVTRMAESITIFA